MKVVRQILATAEFIVEDIELAQTALSDYEQGNADFSDDLLARKNKVKGCLYTATFDKSAGQHELFLQVQDGQNTAVM